MDSGSDIVTFEMNSEGRGYRFARSSGVAVRERKRERHFTWATRRMKRKPFTKLKKGLPEEHVLGEVSGPRV